MKFHDAPHQGEADSCAFVFGVELLEEAEDPFPMFWWDADAVVANEVRWFTLPDVDPDLDSRRGLVPQVFDGVLEQVLDDFSKAYTIAKHGG